MNNSPENAVIIFARYPKKGKVKTRLARTLGEDLAAKFYKVCAEHTFDEISKIHYHKVKAYLFYSDENEKDEIEKWTNSKFNYCLQNGHDLGERMKDAFQKVFNEGASKAIIIGTDLPDISDEIITRAIDLLDEYDFVIGPSQDGGYYLLGMKHLFTGLFENIEWSTNKVYSETIERILKIEKSYKNLSELNDIDNEEDLKNWLKQSSLKKSKLLKNFFAFHHF